MISGSWTSELDEKLVKKYPMPQESSKKGGSHRMLDPEGEEGIYTGSVNADGKAHGKGLFAYDDGAIFSGEFSEVIMREGVVYSNSAPQHSMISGAWTSELDAKIAEKFPMPQAEKDKEEHAEKIVKDKTTEAEETKKVVGETAQKKISYAQELLRASGVRRTGTDAKAEGAETKPEEAAKDAEDIHSSNSDTNRTWCLQCNFDVDQ